MEAARAEADSARKQLTFLLRAGALAAATRNRHDLVDHAAQMVVPGLADHCVVFLPTGEGTLYATSLAHRDPDRAPVLAEFRSHKIPTAGLMAIQVAYTTGTSQVLCGAAAQLPQWHELDSELGDTLARLRADSVLAAPIMAGHRRSGFSRWPATQTGRTSPRPTCRWPTESSRLLADAMANAETSAREHTIAETLRRAVLPGTPPCRPGLDLAVDHLSASDGVHVGGDWSTSSRSAAPGRAGHRRRGRPQHHLSVDHGPGPEHAPRLRHHHPRPRRRAPAENTALARLLPEAMATAVYAVSTWPPATLLRQRRHPPPLLTTGSGHAEYLDDAPVSCSAPATTSPCPAASDGSLPVPGSCLHRRPDRRPLP